MKTFLYWLMLVISFLLTQPVIALQSGGEVSEARKNYLLELKAAEESVLEAMTRVKEAEQVRDLLITVNPPTDKERQLVEEIRKLESNLSEKELIADPEILSNLTAQRVKLLVDIAGLKTRQELNIKLLDQQKVADSEKRALAIEVSRNYLDLALLKKDQLVALHKQGSVPQMELDEAEQEVATARLQLLEKEREMADTDENRALADVHLALAEKRAQLEMVEKLLADASSVRGDVKQLSELKSWLALIKDSRESGMVTILKECEKGLSEYKLRVIELQEQLEKLKQAEPK
jgi:hypothetical protein